MEFWDKLFFTWWGILIVVSVCVLLWLGLSALLYRVFFKRFYDIVLSSLALVVLSPVYLALVLLVALKLGRPVIFRQKRPGKNGKIFSLHKFRTMTNERDESGELLADELRLTRFGKLLRATSLDELPEIWDIFCGKMSIIGPRPMLVRDLVFMNEEIRKRHRVRPGLTGLAQVSGRNNLTWDERFEFDLKYIRRIDLFSDIKIFFRTIFKVIRRSDIATEGMETSEDYGDYLLKINRINEEEYIDLQSKAKDILS